MKPLKPSIHLLYGIIIGILLMACSGSDNTTNQISVQDVRIVGYEKGMKSLPVYITSTRSETLKKLRNQ